MKRFSFRLDRVLDWKSVVAQQEQLALETLHTEREQISLSLRNLSESIDTLSRTAHTAESGHELAYTAQARSALVRVRQRTEQAHQHCEVRIEKQQHKLRTAETEKRLVGKLKQRSFASWSAEVSREMDETAADLYLGGWNRRA